MSSLNLNLLPSQAKFQASKIRLQKKVRMILVGLVSVWLILVIAVFGLNVVTKIRVEAMDSQYQKAQVEYLKMSDNIAISQQLKYKAKMVGGLLSSRFEYGKSFETVKSLFPESIVIQKFDLKEKKIFAIECTTVGQENVDLIEKTIIDINNGKNDKLSSAKLSSLTLKDDVWDFQIEVNLK